MKKQWILFALIMSLALLLRFLFISAIPAKIDGDSSRLALESMRIWKGKLPFFGTGWEAQTNAYLYFLGFFLRLSNNQLFAVRAVSSIGGIISVLSVYLLTRKLFNVKIALWSAFALAVMPFHLVISRMGMELSWTTFFLTLTLYLLLFDNWHCWFLSGIVIGISQYFTPVSRYIPVAVSLLIVFKMKNIKVKSGYIFNAIILLAGFVIIYFFQIKYYLDFPNNYFARISEVSIFNKPYLNPIFFFKQLVNCYLVFQLPVRSSALRYASPYLDPVMALFFTFGIILSLIKIRKWPNNFLMTTLVFGIFLAGAITDDSPMPSRYIIFTPIVAIFIGNGVNKFLMIFKSNRMLFNVLVAFIILSTSLLTYWQREIYLFPIVSDRNSLISSYAARYLMNVHEDYDVYFLGDNNLQYNSIPTIPFLLKKPDGIDIQVPVTEFFKRETIDKKRVNYFIVINSRVNEIKELKNIFPNMIIEKTFYHFGAPLFWILRLDR